MAITRVSTLTSTNSNTYSTSDEWIAEHGKSGLGHEEVDSGTIVADGTNAVTRTLVYADADARARHNSSGNTDASYTAVFVSEEVS